MSARQRAGETTDPATLLGRLSGGDREAFADFYRVTSPRVYGMVLRVLRDPGYTEETVQEVYLQVWRTASSFDPARGSAMSWLITLAHRRAIDRVRSEQASTNRDNAYGAADTTTGYDDVAEAVVRGDEQRAVADCLETLTAVQRSSVDLAYYGGLTYRQVAERLQVALPTVKSRMRDGLARLRDCLGGQSRNRRGRSDG
ncbi:sigma-70 family RNA polymerase sigma factor [Tomitella cavernea]|uniref:sigma-70 family RNA polymerase sigma factor n=1 Tax=Tomitella cavernea TaxID=1387982 RepID=UPI0027DE3D1C|nr:sigma-70 family RNA polymerase sigma factor [Tomitella cavernea]